MSEANGLSLAQAKELQHRIEDLLNKDKDAPYLLASRAALRALPTLGYSDSEYFFYWPDSKLESFYTVFMSALSGYQRNAQREGAWAAATHNIFLRSSLNQAIPSFIPEAISAADYGGITTNTERQIVKAIQAAMNATAHFGMSMSAMLEEDLSTLENAGRETLLTRSLWGNTPISSEYMALADTHLSKLSYQYEQHYRNEDPKAADLIRDAHSVFMDIFNGNPDLGFIGECFDRLSNYLSDGLRRNSELGGRLKTEERQYLSSLLQNEDGVAKDDKLNRAKLVATLAEMLLENTQKSNKEGDTPHHQTIGLLGDWGSGKSSIIAQLKETLLSKKDEQPFLFAEFNAWEYEHTDNIQAGIAQEMIQALTSQEELAAQDTSRDDLKWTVKLLKWLRWKLYRAKLICCFARRIQGFKLIWLILLFFSALLPICPPILELLPLESLLNGVGEEVKSLFPIAWLIGIGYPLWQQGKKVFAGPLAKELRTYLKLPDYAKHLGMIPVMQDHIKKLVDVRLNTSKSKKRLIYVIDDLDRCSHEGIVKVLEAVRLVLDLKNVTVIIAVDQRIAMAALALHYQELEPYHAKGDARQIARDYLAKIIHFPIQLTKPDQASVSGYLASLWQHDKVEEIITNAPDNRSTNTAEAVGTKPEKELPAPAEVPSDLEDDERNEFKPGAPGEDSVEKKITVIKRLSPAQQEAFKHWVLYFDLTNPRQLKRLNNSYIFLLNYHKNDELPDRATSVHSPVESGFPILATLCTLEYLNDLDDRKLRHVLKQQLEIVGGFSPILKEDKEKRESSKITESVIALAGIEFNTQTGAITAYKAVEPFVLPSSSES